VPADAPRPAGARVDLRNTEDAEATEVALDRTCAARGWNWPKPERREAYSAERLPFAVRFRDEVNPYSVMSVFVLPGEALDLQPLGGPESEFELCADAGAFEAAGDGSWRWHAPELSGRTTTLGIRDRDSGTTMRFNALVLRPYQGEETVGGYRIGSYERAPLRQDPAYEMPRALIQVAEEDLDLWVTPHFQLRQFLCKQDSAFPKYLVMRERLLLKLETLLEEMNDHGLEARSFSIMSAYRTPFYNRAIGNTTTYSRHGYGDAADIFIDEDQDGTMDDLDGDGRVTARDAEVMHRIVEQSLAAPQHRPFVGGLGLYGPKPHRGPFIHVDTRGHEARWNG
jgi:hypothetical protein